MTREVLSEEQMAFYSEQGYLVLEGRIPENRLQEVRDEIARYVEKARGMTTSDLEIDLEDSHRPEAPRVRRIKTPNRHSEVFRRLMLSDLILAPARDLLGPNLRLHTSKLNMKSAGYGAAVEWHQDWAFYPHTNDGVLALGVVIDDMAMENGPLMVFPGSHKGPTYDHHSEGYFVGAMDLVASGLDPNEAVALTAPAGSITLHHARLVHGSGVNRSDRARRLLFYEVRAADAWPLAGGLSAFESLEGFNAEMLCGEPTIEPRMVPTPIRIPAPPPPAMGSIFEIQEGLKARAFEQV